MKAETYDVAMLLNNPSLVGMCITGINVPLNAAATVTDCKAWLTKQLTLESGNNVPDIASIDFTPNGNWVEVTFAEPYTITEEGVYAGYSLTVPSVDTDNANDPNKVPIMCIASEDLGNLYMHTSRSVRKWRNLPETAYYGTGAYAMVIRLTGDNVKEYAAALLPPDELKTYQAVGENTTLTLQLENHGIAAISNIDYEMMIGGETIEKHVNVTLEGGYFGSKANLMVEIPAQQTAGTYPVSITVKKLDGVDNEDVQPTTTFTMAYLSEFPKHKPLMEEYTGTWCQYCPRGMAGMEAMNKLYPDDFVGVAFHNGDAMAITQLYPNEVNAFPNSYLDRVQSVNPFSGSSGASLGIEDDWKNRQAVIAPASLSMETRWINDEKTQLEVTAIVHFVRDFDNSPYQLTYILTADGLKGNGGEWSQQNALSGDELAKSDPYLSYYANLPTVIQNIEFNNVAIQLASSRGFAMDGTLPLLVKANESYRNTYVFDISNNSLVQDKTRLRPVAVLIDTRTGEVVNAEKIKNIKDFSIISFTDVNVKAICVQNWDTSGDGELSEAEAAAVTDLGTVFKGNKEITSFNELQYFSSITKLESQSFEDCENLKSIVIPENVMSLGYAAFAGCHSLESANIPNGVTTIEGSLFRYCEKLPSVIIPEGVTKIGLFAFDQCYSLTSVSLPSTIITIEPCAFGFCNSLVSVTVAMTTPVPLTDGNDFMNHANATLFVPKGCKAAYEVADYWKDFKEIVELEPSVTNTLSASVLTLLIGNQATLSLNLTNEDELIAFEFDLQLPDGITIAKDEDNDPIAMLSSRASKHSLAVSDQGNGLYHFLCYSNTNKIISGSEGELLSIELLCDENTAVGTYQATVKNIIFSDVGKNKITPADVTFDLEVIEAEPGDVNKDGEINVMDVVEMVAYIMGDGAEGFVFAAADLYPDGAINVMDLVNLVDLIMNSSASNAREWTDNSMSLSALADGVVSVKVNNPEQYVASEFIVEVSAGQTLETVTADKHHRVTCSQLDDSHYKVMTYSSANSTFNSDALVQLHISGEGMVNVHDALLVDESRKGVAFAPAVGGYTTGINQMENGKLIIENSSVYDLQGKKRDTSRPYRHEVLIVNGKKQVVR